MSHLAFITQPQRITALWPVIISRPTEGSRLSWPELTLFERRTCDDSSTWRTLRKCAVWSDIRRSSKCVLRCSTSTRYSVTREALAPSSEPSLIAVSTRTSGISPAATAMSKTKKRWRELVELMSIHRVTWRNFIIPNYASCSGPGMAAMMYRAVNIYNTLQPYCRSDASTKIFLINRLI